MGINEAMSLLLMIYSIVHLCMYIHSCRKKIAPDSRNDNILSTKTSKSLKQSLMNSLSPHKDKEIHVKKDSKNVVVETEIENEVTLWNYYNSYNDLNCIKSFAGSLITPRELFSIQRGTNCYRQYSVMIYLLLYQFPHIHHHTSIFQFL